VVLEVLHSKGNLSMVEIEFSVMANSEEEANRLIPLLEVFEQQYHIHVNLTTTTWAKGWAEIAKFGIFSKISGFPNREKLSKLLASC
jgi:O-phosphoseryl-tRNA(Cys) synthetase